MTKEQAREAALAMLAWADGKEVEGRFSNGWVTVDIPDWNWLHVEFRIKPTAKLRPWTADEVPLGAFIRPRLGSWRSLILAVDSDWRIMVHCGAFTREAALERHEHSLDGKTWLPCGVVEEGK